MRLFVAVPVGEGTRRALQALVTRWRRPGDGLRWTRPEGWHITLAFLGETAPERLPNLTGQLSRVKATQFRVEFGASEVFERAGALVVGVRLTAALEALQQAVNRAVAEAGFRPEERAYRPHLTLARARRGERIRLRTDEAAIEGFEAREFVLYESSLEPGGARYEAQGRFALNS